MTHSHDSCSYNVEKAVNYYKRNKWIFGWFMCKFCRTLSKINMYCSIFFLTALSVDRAIAVTRPSTSVIVRTRLGIHLVAASIWIISTILSIPGMTHSMITHSMTNIKK